MQATVNAQSAAIQQLRHSLEQAKGSYADLQGEVTFTKQRLGTTQVELHRTQQSSAQLARQQKETAQQVGSQLGQLQQEQAATQGTIGNLSSDVAGVKDGLNATNSDLSATKENLSSTRSDLQRVVGDLGVQSDLIARNGSELAELRLRGERDYREFDLRKSKQPERVGDIAISLRKTDVKRQRFTINLIADDRNIEKKDKTVNEPVQF